MDRIETLLDLLDRWDDTLASDRATPEEFCSEHPGLLDEFRQLLGQRDVLAALLNGGNSPELKPEAMIERMQDGRFPVVQFHDQGGLGWVYLAKDRELGRMVALKCLQPEPATDPEARRRFVREAEITARLEHPGVVPIYGLGGLPQQESPSYAMRFVQGETLRTIIRDFHESHGNQDWSGLDGIRILRSFVTVCETIAYAHSKNVIHRDLKSSNVMIGAFGETLVLDWGLAKLLTEPEDPPVDSAPNNSETQQPRSFPLGATLSGATLGTVGFMSPEQARGDWASVKPAADIFSLGAILYQILTNRAPYQGDGALTSARECTFQPPQVIASSVPKPLAAVCMKAMQSEPNQRYVSALELKNDIERYLADEPVSAHRESIVERLHRFRRKNRIFVNMAAATGLAAIVLLSIFLSITSQKNRELVQANQLVLSAKDEAILQRDRAQSERINTEVEFYRARMSLIARAFSDRKPKLLADLVQTTQPELSQPVDSRGLEWWIAWKKSYGDRHLLPISDVTVKMQRLMDQGRELLSLSDDGRIRVIDTTTGRELMSRSANLSFESLPIEEPDDLPCSEDGSIVAIVRGVTIDIMRFNDGAYSLDKSLEINVGMEGGDEIAQKSVDQVDYYVNISLAGDGSRLVACTAQGLVQLWDVKSGKSELLDLQDSDRPSYIRLSPDGKSLGYLSHGAMFVRHLETGQTITVAQEQDLSFKGLTFGQYETLVGWTNVHSVTYSIDFPHQLSEVWRNKITDSPVSETSNAIRVSQFVREWIELESPNEPLLKGRLYSGDHFAEVRSTRLAVIRPNGSRWLFREPVGTYPWQFPLHMGNYQPDRLTELTHPSILELVDVSADGKVGLLKHDSESLSTIATVEFAKECIDVNQYRGSIESIAWSTKNELISISEPSTKPSRTHAGSMDHNVAELDIRREPFAQTTSDIHEPLVGANCIAGDGSVIANYGESQFDIRLPNQGKRYQLEKGVIDAPDANTELHLAAWNWMAAKDPTGVAPGFWQILGKETPNNADAAQRPRLLPWVLAWSNREPIAPQSDAESSPSAATIQIVDYEAGKRIANLEGTASQLTAVVISPNGQTIAALSKTGNVRTWQITDNNGIVSGPECSLSSEASCMALSNDGRLLVVGLQNGDLVAFDRENLSISQFKAHEGSVLSVVFSADDQRLVTAGADRTMALFDSRVWAEVFRFKLAAQPTCLAVNRKNQMIAVGNADGHVELIEPGEPAELMTLAYRWLHDPVTSEYSTEVILRQLWAEFVGEGRSEQTMEVARGVLESLRPLVSKVPLSQLKTEFLQGLEAKPMSSSNSGLRSSL